MLCRINKKLICLIYTGEVAKQVSANSLNIHMGSSSKIQEIAMSKNRRQIAQQGNTLWAAYHFLLHRLDSEQQCNSHAQQAPSNEYNFHHSFVLTMGWTVSCMAFNSSQNTHNFICSCWKFFAYDNDIFNGIHHSKKRH